MSPSHFPAPLRSTHHDLGAYSSASFTGEAESNVGKTSGVSAVRSLSPPLLPNGDPAPLPGNRTLFRRSLTAENREP